MAITDRRCPKCGSGMTPETHKGTTLYRCPRQHGFWFDAGELTRFASLHGRHRLKEKVVRERLMEAWTVEETLSCPGCGSCMGRGQVEGLDLAVCWECRGFMLPIRTLNRLEPLSSGRELTAEEKAEWVWSAAVRIGALIGIVTN